MVCCSIIVMNKLRLRHIPITRGLAQQRRYSTDVKEVRELELRQLQLLKDLETLKADVRTHDLRNDLRYYASKAQTRLDLDNIIQFIVVKQYNTSVFLQRELPIRFAHHVLELWKLPNGLYHMPSVRAARRQYVQSFMDVLSFPPFKVQCLCLLW